MAYFKKYYPIYFYYYLLQFNKHNDFKINLIKQEMRFFTTIYNPSIIHISNEIILIEKTKQLFFGFDKIKNLNYDTKNALNKIKQKKKYQKTSHILNILQDFQKYGITLSATKKLINEKIFYQLLPKINHYNLEKIVDAN